MEDIYLIGIFFGAILFFFLLLTLILRKVLGLEKFYPSILLFIVLCLFILIVFKRIDQVTFGTSIGVIVGAFVTAFLDIVKSILGKKE